MPDGVPSLSQAVPGKSKAIWVVGWLVLLLFLGNMVWLSYRNGVDSDHTARHERQSFVLSEMRSILQYRLSVAITDAKLIASGKQLSRYAGGEDSTREIVTERMIDLMNARPDTYSQVRYINEKGKEAIRINQSGSGLVHVTTDALQDKSDRDYFIRAMKAPPGEIQLSAMDLNVEHDQVEVPYRPTLRVSTRIEDAQGQPRGVVVLNFLGNSLLDRLSAVGNGPGASFWLFDSDGNWMVGPNPDWLWGQSMPDRQAYAVAKTYPALWQTSRGLEDGATASWQDSDTSYLVSRFSVLRAPPQSGLESVRTLDAGNWYLVSRLAPGALGVSASESRMRHIAVFAVLAVAGTLLYGWLVTIVMRKRTALIALAQREAAFDALLESAPDATLSVDEGGTIQAANGQAARTFGFDREALIGMQVDELVPTSTRGGHGDRREHYLANPEPRAMADGKTLYALREDGSAFPVSIALSAVDTPEGKRVICAVRDMTEHQRASEALKQALQDSQAAYVALQDAQGANSAKSMFLAHMSHELRTPLNAVIGLAYLLEQTPLNISQRGNVSRIRTATRAILSIVNDILDLAKIEAGELDLDRSVFRLADLIDDLRAIVAPEAEAHGLVLDLVYPSGQVPNWVKGDESRVRQVLLNLLNNAVKFTQEGTVRLDVKLVESPDTPSGDCCLQFSVSDTGIGIESAQIERLFKPYTQVDKSPGRLYAGTGLGLSIVKQLTERMGGRVGVESEIGIGSTFWVELPLGICVDGEENAQEEQKAHLNIVFAEDDPTQREAFMDMAHRLGWRAYAVPDGETLVEEVLRRMADGHRVDCLVVDWDLPGMDGLRAIHMIRAALGSSVPMPASVVLTAHSLRALKDAAHAEEADSLLVKPIDISMMFNEVSKAVLKSRGAADHLLDHTKVDSAPVLWLPGISVLLVDDSDLNLDVAKQILQREGASVTVCGSGTQAKEWLGDRVNAELAMPDLVLMDVQMPALDGNAVVRWMRSQESMKRIPVVALTASAMLSERDKALRAGMNDYLTKPVNPDQMIRTVRRHVERVRGVPLPTVPRPSRSPQSARPDIKVPGLDTADALQRVHGDVHAYIGMLNRFATEFSNWKKPDAQDMSAEELKKFANALHRLSGHAGLIGATHLRVLAQTLEQRIRDDELQGLDNSLERLGMEMQAVLANVQAGLAQSEREHWDVPPPPLGEHRLDASALRSFVHLLRAGKYTSLERFRELSAGFSEALPEAEYQVLAQAMERMDFQKALRMLDEHMPSSMEE